MSRKPHTILINNIPDAIIEGLKWLTDEDPKYTKEEQLKLFWDSIDDPAKFIDSIWYGAVRGIDDYFDDWYGTIEEPDEWFPDSRQVVYWDDNGNFTDNDGGELTNQVCIYLENAFFSLMLREQYRFWKNYKKGK